MDIGFIGLGIMGSRMAAHLIEGGHRLWAYDLAPSAMENAVAMGASACRSIREVSDGRDALFLSLPNPSDVEQVVLGQEGVLSAATAPALLIDATTSLPSVSRRVAAAAKEKGCLMLDAPVTGGPEGAEAGTLTILVGASPEAFENALPLLRLLGKEIFHVGDVGAGNTAKLVNNLLLGIGLGAISEGLMMGMLAGIEPRKLYEVISAGTGNSVIFQRKVPRILKGDFQPGFAVDLMHKDLNLAAQLGQELGMPMPLVNLARQLFQVAKAAKLGSSDSSAVIIPLEKLMGVDIREG